MQTFKRRKRLQELLAGLEDASVGATKSERLDIERHRSRLERALLAYPLVPARKTPAGPRPPREQAPIEAKAAFPFEAAQHLMEHHSNAYKFLDTLGKAIAFIPREDLERQLGKDLVTVVRETLNGGFTRDTPARLAAALPNRPGLLPSVEPARGADTPPPALRMLWEDVDPGEALTERFGFAHPSDVADFASLALAEHWGLKFLSCDEIVLSDHNALAWVTTYTGRFLLKWSVLPERFERLQSIADVTAWLADRNEPVSGPIRTSGGDAAVRTDHYCLTLQHAYEGFHLNPEDHIAVRRAGAVLARLHDALAAYPKLDSIPGLTAPDTYEAQIIGWLGSHPDADPAGATRLRDEIATLKQPSTQPQLVHGDYRSANVLTEYCRVAAVLDFEEARLDHPIGELARSAVMLGTQFHDWGPVPAATHNAFRAGYETIRPLGADEAAWWKPLLLWWTMMLTPVDNDTTDWSQSIRRQLTSWPPAPIRHNTARTMQLRPARE